jgi:hypothetical protein
MKTFFFASTTAVAVLAFSGCDQSQTKTSEQVPENGAQFKEDVGVTLSETMKKSIGLRVQEVAEEKIAPVITVPLHVSPPAGRLQEAGKASLSKEASGWITQQQASLLKVGTEIEVKADTPNASSQRAKVARVEKSPYATLGDYELVVELATPAEQGTRLVATYRAEAGEAVTAIPREALLTTAEGTFVYAANDHYFVRTPVKVGARGAEHVEISDGLYAGDEVVVSPVTSLWLAELQILRGGKACTCGH